MTDSVNLFISEGAGVDAIIKEMEASGEEIPDAFGHIKLDTVNPGAWFGKQFAEQIGAEKVLTKIRLLRSSRCQMQTALIKACADVAVDSALQGIGGVAAHDEDQDNELGPLSFHVLQAETLQNRGESWFGDLLKKSGKPKVLS